MTPTRDPGEQNLVVDAEAFQVEVSQALATLEGNLRLIHQLVDTHQRGLGFMSVEAKSVVDQQVRREREARLWNEQNLGGVKVSGDVPTPGNLSAWALSAEIHLTLRHVVRRLVRALDHEGVCTTLRLPAEPSTSQLVAHIRRLSWDITSPAPLIEATRDLDYLNGEAGRLIDGHDRVRLDGACPHCDRKTLVVTFADGVIRCDRDPHTGRYEDCVCPDGYCDCKTNPRHRHEWHRDKGTSSSGWWALADRLNLTKQIHQ